MRFIVHMRERMDFLFLYPDLILFDLQRRGAVRKSSGAVQEQYVYNYSGSREKIQSFFRELDD